MAENPVYIRMFMDASTSHITEKDNEILSGQVSTIAPMLSVEATERGFWIYVTEDPEVLQEILDWSRQAGLSDEFRDLYSLARREKVSYLKLDGDGYEIPGLKTFHW